MSGLCPTKFVGILSRDFGTRLNEGYYTYHECSIFLIVQKLYPKFIPGVLLVEP
ncbi:hypothetical protein HanIR_Chr01g0025981 [Helianthus annuus]|nr:hypothetical protein HanIR_Chr01g0025981 [Helianthus annuus]